MATVTTLVNNPSTALFHASSMGNNTRVPYWVEHELNWADALTAKGSALASSDVFEVLRIPANTVVLHAGAYVKTVGNATAATIHVGTGGDNDEWVASLDIIAAAAYGADLSASPVMNTYSATDTIDVTLATLTGTLSTGKVRVYALMLDVSEKDAPGIAALGS